MSNDREMSIVYRYKPQRNFIRHSNETCMCPTALETGLRTKSVSKIYDLFDTSGEKIGKLMCEQVFFLDTERDTWSFRCTNSFVSRRGTIIVPENVIDLPRSSFNKCWCFNTDISFTLSGQGVSGDFLNQQFKVLYEYYQENGINQRRVTFTPVGTDS